MKDYAVYNEDKSLKTVVINNVVFRYVRPESRYKTPEIVAVGKPVKKRSHAEARQMADAWVGVTKH